MELFRPLTCEPRWSSFENPTAARGSAGRSNKGRKGAAFAPLAAGETTTLLDLQGPGIVRRMWMTMSDRSPKMLRSLRIDCYWDDSPTPAVSAPLGDFFLAMHGRMVTFENALFCSPEGRSFVCTIPMPFRSRARITLSNESDRPVSQLFYDVNCTLEPVEDAWYFHAHFRRERPTTLGTDFTILPHVQGRGRFLGAHVGLILPMVYDRSWWGEGEVKMFLDGDTEYPTLCGTGAEDYISSAYGQGTFKQALHGSTLADEKTRQWAFYRYHIPDPIVFKSDIRVTLQQIGGAMRDRFVEIQRRGAPIQAITATPPGEPFRPLEDEPAAFDAATVVSETWINFLREDDVAAVSLFYLDRPENGLPPLIEVDARTVDVLAVNDDRRADV
jgi:hypothetical protein